MYCTFYTYIYTYLIYIYVCIFKTSFFIYFFISNAYTIGLQNYTHHTYIHKRAHYA